MDQAYDIQIRILIRRVYKPPPLSKELNQLAVMVNPSRYTYRLLSTEVRCVDAIPSSLFQKSKYRPNITDAHQHDEQQRTRRCCSRSGSLASSMAYDAPLCKHTTRLRPCLYFPRRHTFILKIYPARPLWRPA